MNLTERLFEIANLGAEWVLWLLIGLSIVSVAIIAEKAFFVWRRNLNIDVLQGKLAQNLHEKKYEAAIADFREIDTMEGRVLFTGLEKHHLGVASVSELMTGAMVNQKQRYEKSLSFLATLGSNAPFIGLLGTVLGIIQAFSRFDINGGAEASSGIMAAISEALVATGVGLFVAIPAVIAFNYFNGKVKKSTANTEQLVRTFLGYISATPCVDSAKKTTE